MAISATAPSTYDYTIFVKDTDNYSSVKIAMDNLKISDLFLSFNNINLVFA